MEASDADDADPLITFDVGFCAALSASKADDLLTIFAVSVASFFCAKVECSANAGRESASTRLKVDAPIS